MEPEASEGIGVVFFFLLNFQQLKGIQFKSPKCFFILIELVSLKKKIWFSFAKTENDFIFIYFLDADVHYVFHRIHSQMHH